jgi:dephospho-CoA kinase
MKKIIAIIWTAWAGKDYAWDFLSKKLWIPIYQISEALKITAREKWIEHSRENLIKIGKEFAE